LGWPIPVAALNPTRTKAARKASRRLSVQGNLPRKLKATPPAGYIAVLEKDCLRVDKWDTDAGPWNVTHAVLDDIVKQYKLYRKRGYKSHYVWNHDDDAKKGVGMDVLDLVRRGDELLAICGVKSEKALARAREHDQVSIYVDEHVDGKGNYYPQLLKHIGMVHHPVVNNQRPFKRLLSRNPSMAKQTKLSGKGRRLAAEGEETEGGDGAATEMSVKAVVALLNEHFQVSIPENVDTEKELGIALEMLAKGQDPTGAGDETDSAAAGEEAVEDPMTAVALAKGGKVGEAAKKLAAENAALKKQLEEQKARQLSRAKKNFEAEASDLVKTGRITAAERTDLDKEGKRFGYRLSILAGYKKLPANHAGTIKTRVASRGATGTPPGQRSAEDEDKRAEGAAEAILGRKLSKNQQPAKTN
jgi:hypothetical protein